MQSDIREADRGDDRRLVTLEGLLSIRSTRLGPALNEAAMPVARALGAEKIDVFLYDPNSDSLVALGASDTPLADRQRRCGLDRLALSNGGRVVSVFRTGISYLDGRVELDDEELRGVRETLRARSQIAVPLLIAGRRRGVLSALSTAADQFDDRDVRFTEAVAGWIGVIAERAELAEGLVKQAFEQGQRDAAAELSRLTPRQRELAAYIAEGLSNDEIAERLVLTPGTVANHVAGILDRLNLRNRTQIATWAVERGLYTSGSSEYSTHSPFGAPLDD